MDKKPSKMVTFHELSEYKEFTEEDVPKTLGKTCNVALKNVMSGPHIPPRRRIKPASQCIILDQVGHESTFALEMDRQYSKHRTATKKAMLALPNGDFCPQCDEILVRTGQRCKNPASCMTGCPTKCYVHSDYHKTGVCDQQVRTDQDRALRNAEVELEHLRLKREELQRALLNGSWIDEYHEEVNGL